MITGAIPGHRPGVFHVAALLLLCLPLAVFAGGEVEGAAATTGVLDTSIKESPMLSDMVEAGKLPPLAERLPNEPLVLEPNIEPGQYGGTLRAVYGGPAEGHTYARYVVDPLVRFTVDGSDIVTNLAKSFEITDDARVYTFYLREGLKWSDGAPHTADDFLFYANDIYLNKELNPSPFRWFTSGGEPMKMEKLGDYAIRVTFAEPYTLFLRQLAFRGRHSSAIAAPAHYLKQFHPTYTDKATVDRMARQEGLDAWTDLFEDRNDYWYNSERPGTGAWLILTEPGEQLISLERNPYYWKVDPAGRQLPYIDKVEMQLVEDYELIVIKAANGEIDLEFNVLGLEDYTFLKENEQKGDYRVLTYDGDRAAHVAFWPNMSYQNDPRLGELMSNSRFKEALSLGIDRDELNELFYYGLGVPRSITAIDSEPTYEEDVARMHIEYNPEKANRILDELGFDKRNAKGIRLFPDGEPISFVMDWATSWPVHGKVAEVVSDYWRDLGIDTVVKAHERSVFYELSYSNSFAMSVFQSPGTSLVNNWWIIPWYHNSNGYGVWHRTGGEEGVAPPEGSLVRKAIDLYYEAMAEPDFDDMVAGIKQLLRWKNENLWGIGTVGMQPKIGVASNRLGNVPENSPSGWHLVTPSNTRPEQYFIRQ